MVIGLAHRVFYAEIPKLMQNAALDQGNSCFLVAFLTVQYKTHILSL
jgi:hypothetical protein